MTREEISLKIRTLIAEQLKKPLDSITERNSLVELGADSLDTVQIIMKLEEEFKIEIRDDEVQHLTTVGQTVDYIEKKLK